MEWLRKESEHYVFNFRKDTLAERDLDKIIKLQESCYEYICSFLRVNMDMKMNYFLCSTPEEVGEIYGDNEPASGFAKSPDKIYAVYNEKIKCTGYHEDAHLISYNTLSRPKQTFIREGLAMFFDRVWWGIPNQAWVKRLIERGALPGIGNLMNNDEFYKYSDTITYPIAGAFTEYLFNLYGVEKYKEFYLNVTETINECFINSFKITLEDAEKKFINYISTIKFNDVINERIRRYLEERVF